MRKSNDFAIESSDDNWQLISPQIKSDEEWCTVQ
jgi:hypothetical protein